MSKRPKLPPPSEQMKHISGLLTRELLQWPDVTTRPMFGLRAFYRGTVLFAMLPDKRAFESPDGIAYKLAPGDPNKPGQTWHVYELENALDIDKALAHLDKAFKQAVRTTRK